MLESLRFLLGLCEACAYPTFNRALRQLDARR